MRRLLRLLTALLLTLIVAVAVALMTFGYLALRRENLPPRAAAGSDGKYVTAGGLAIHYKEWGPPSGKPLVLMPGSFAWSETFRDIAIPLGELGWRVISPDMPPFGYSERPSDHDYGRSAQAGRLLDFADALKLEKFALGVHSYGGGAAIEAAFISPERIEGLVLMDVALGLGREANGPPLAWLLKYDAVRNLLTAATFTNPLMIGKGLRDFVADDAIVTPERIEIYARPGDVEGTTVAVGLWLFTGLYADERDSYSADLANYRAFEPPVLVIWGRDDTVTPLAQGEEIAAAFPKGRLQVLDRVNHIPHVERPAEVVSAIDDFLRGLSPPAQESMAAPLVMPELKGTVEP